MLCLFIICILGLQCLVGAQNVPEQIHLSYTAVANEMAVTWSTQAATKSPYVEFSERGSSFTLKENAVMSKFVDGGSAHRVLYVYRAVMSNLTLNTTYGKQREIQYERSESFCC
mgnify:FL=1